MPPHTDHDDVPDPDSIDRAAILDRIENIDLPTRVEKYARGYERHVGVRDQFIWKWLYATLMEVTLDTVPEEYRETIWEDKTIATIYIVMLDDLAENQEDLATFKEATKFPYARQQVNYMDPGVDVDVLKLADRIWDDVERNLRDTPQYGELNGFLRFDMHKVFLAHEHSYLINNNVMSGNITELLNYSTHDMSMLVYSDIDLMYSPEFDADDLGRIRNVVYCAQEIGRMGNWLTTWNRELTENDYSSGIVIWALQHEVLTPEELAAARHGDIDSEEVAAVIREHDVEGVFYDQLQEKFERLSHLVNTTTSIDLTAYEESIKQLFRHQVAAAGSK